MEVIGWGFGGKLFKGKHLAFFVPLSLRSSFLLVMPDLRLVWLSHRDFYYVPKYFLGVKNSLLKQYLFLAICQVLLILGRNAFMDATDLS